jgi:nitrate/nitrite-specific signal transduction histidine kinase
MRQQTGTEAGIATLVEHRLRASVVAAVMLMEDRIKAATVAIAIQGETRIQAATVAAAMQEGGRTTEATLGLVEAEVKPTKLQTHRVMPQALGHS